VDIWNGRPKLNVGRGGPKLVDEEVGLCEAEQVEEG
jgi:hypothetical protein